MGNRTASAPKGAIHFRRAVAHCALLLAAVSPAACGTSTRGAGSGGDGGSASDPLDLSVDNADLVLSRNRDLGCAQVSAMATLGKAPVDIVFVIDNSNSMTDKIGSASGSIFWMTG